ncbi:hypothetical protein GGI01_001409 [Coemansia sp. RSA 376]|nr:hypothetical protein H4S03_008089 [Coemansia sp. S3946]KAJ2095858.1 hypothetical protein IW146_010461 [Coemansia sp. RSA 922]KAJ2262598.1 hypothetical protein GGI01_001409 [Coemansia sp. RSA 376]KAJ2343277.1 hypothetical protein GGH92_004999 [Coemansia sp. RSA 2673]
MDSDKQCLQQTSAANAMQPTPPGSAPHDVFLNLQLEPFLSSSLMDLLDVLVYPAQISPSVPSTPPPTYEHPPPSYPSSDAWSITSFSTLSLGQLSDSASFMSSSDAMSIVTSEIIVEDNSTSNSSIVVGSGAPLELQNRLLLNLVVYELLTRQSTLSRSPSRASGMTRSSEFLD